MTVNWNDIQRSLSPVKDFEDLCRRYRVSFSFHFVRQVFNFTMPELATYTDRLLGGDSRGRYTEYLSRLEAIISDLQNAGVQGVLDLKERTASRTMFEDFVEHSGIPAPDSIAVLKFMVFWFIPGEKYLSGLVRGDPFIKDTLSALSAAGIRTNLQMLQQGLTPAGRATLVKSTGLPPEIIAEWVNRADFSRMPWASKATISNILGAGYSSLEKLANADPEKLYANFFRYGKSIGKNLKLGNEIENSYRIARIVPRLVIGE